MTPSEAPGRPGMGPGVSGRAELLAGRLAWPMEPDPDPDQGLDPGLGLGLGLGLGAFCGLRRRLLGSGTLGGLMVRCDRPGQAPFGALSTQLSFSSDSEIKLHSVRSG